LKQVANLCYQKAHYAADHLSRIDGYKLAFNQPFFHEFTLRCPQPAAEINTHLLEHGIVGGYDLGQDNPALSDYLLLAVTEMNTKEEIDLLVDVLQEGSHD